MSIVKASIIFAGGFTAGVLAAKVYFEDTYKKNAEEEIESVKEYYKKKLKTVKPDLDSLSSMEEPPILNNLSKEELQKAKEVAESLMEKYNYSDISKNTKKESEKKEVTNIFDNEEALAETERPKEEYTGPYSIDAQDFVNNENFYDQSTLIYYTEDDSLVNESEELVDVDYMIGNENLKIFADSSDDEMYIRNEKLGIDFEVVKVIGSFAEEIGMNE